MSRGTTARFDDQCERNWTDWVVSELGRGWDHHSRRRTAVQIQRRLAPGPVVGGERHRQALRELEQSWSVAASFGGEGDDQIELSASVTDASDGTRSALVVVAMDADAAVPLDQPRTALHREVELRRQRVVAPEELGARVVDDQDPRAAAASCFGELRSRGDQQT